MSVTNDAPSPLDQSAPAASASGRSQLRWRKVFLIVAPVALLLAAGLAFLRFGDVDALLASVTRPPLAPAKGVVFFKGEPLKNAQIVTEPTSSRGMSAMGWTDDEGRFSLTTDIRGKREEGATVGEHRVAVKAHQVIPGPAAPPLLTPEEYATVSTTPLRIVVAKTDVANESKLVLEGDAPARPVGGRGAGKAKGGKGRGAPRGSIGGTRPDNRPPENASDPAVGVEGESKPLEAEPSEIPSPESSPADPAARAKAPADNS
jgi:hypothetical protein